MYADGGLLFPYLQGLDFYREAQQQCHHLQLQEDELLWRLQNSIMVNNSGSSSSSNSSSSSSSCYQQGSQLPVVSTPSGNTLAQTSWISEYDLGGEGDLFKAPEPILEEAPQLAFDPMATAISMISGGEDITAGEAVARAAAAAVEMNTMVSSDPLLSEVFYECRKDLLAKSAIEEEPAAVEEMLEIEIPELQPEPEPRPQIFVEEERQQRDRVVGAEGALQKSVSSGCLLSNEWSHGGMPPRPSFLGFQDLDLGAAFGMRRAYSEGDIKTLESGSSTGNANTREIFRSEERQEKLSRYRKKKSKRNFGRKIKYACRKALADSQPRVRGRFARTEESEVARH